MVKITPSLVHAATLGNSASGNVLSLDSHGSLSWREDATIGNLRVETDQAFVLEIKNGTSTFLIQTQGIEDLPLNDDTVVTGQVYHMDSPEDAPPPGKVYNGCIFVFYGDFRVPYSEPVVFTGCTLVKKRERTLAEQLGKIK